MAKRMFMIIKVIIIIIILFNLGYIELDELVLVMVQPYARLKLLYCFKHILKH